MKYIKLFEKFKTYNIIAYHGSKELFDNFKTISRGDGYYVGDKLFKNYYHTGETEFIYFSDSLENAEKYGDYIYTCELNIIDPYILDVNGGNYYSICNKIEFLINDFIDTNLNKSIIIKNIQDSPSKYGDGLLSTTYMVKPEYIKILNINKKS